MLFLFPRRCIRTRLEFLAKKSRTWRRGRRDRLVAGKHLQLTYARNTCVFSASRLRAATLLPFLRCPPRFFRRELAPASIVRNSRRETARNGDSISPAHVRSFESQLSPLLRPPPGEFVRVEEKGIEGGRWFCTARKIVFDNRVLTSAQKRKENKEIVRRVNVEIVHTKMWMSVKIKRVQFCADSSQGDENSFANIADVD